MYDNLGSKNKIENKQDSYKKVRKRNNHEIKKKLKLKYKKEKPTYKVDIPDFLGKLEPNAFEDWLTAIEDYFDWFAVSEDRKVRYVRMKLKGHARAWWGECRGTIAPNT